MSDGRVRLHVPKQWHADGQNNGTLTGQRSVRTRYREKEQLWYYISLHWQQGSTCTPRHANGLDHSCVRFAAVERNVIIHPRFESSCANVLSNTHWYVRLRLGHLLVLMQHRQDYSTAYHSTAQHNAAQHSTAEQSTAQHSRCSDVSMGSVRGTSRGM